MAPEIKSENTPIEQAPEQGSELLFYNVMPKTKDSGPLVSPTLAISTQQGETSNGSSGFRKFLQNKIVLYGIIGAVIAIIGFGVFAYYKWWPRAENVTVTKNNTTKPKNESGDSSNEEYKTPLDWRESHFGKCEDQKSCKDNEDPDMDGLSNIEEYNKKTDPINKDCDGDKISDGDEVHIFSTDPLNDHSGTNPKYSDFDNIKGGYNPHTDAKYTENELKDIKAKLDQYGIHMPTAESLHSESETIYHLGQPAETPTQPEVKPATTSTTSVISGLSGNLDMSDEAKLDRDSQRSSAISKIGIALIKYYDDKKAFPKTTIFSDMASQIKPYLRVATKTADPINKEPYIYTYAPSADGKDYTITFFSEIAGKVIKKHAQDARDEKLKDEASNFDDQRKRDLEIIRTGLLLYSSNNAGPEQDDVFPPEDKYKTELLTNDYVPDNFPKDPKTGLDYEYRVSEKFNTFTLKAKYDDPPNGSTGWMCNQDNCDYY